MRDEINKNYGRYLLKEAAELRAAQIREVGGGALPNHRGHLRGDGREFSQYQSFDEEAAARVKEILVDNGIEPLEVCCPPGPLRPHDGGGGNLPAAAAAGKPGGVHSGG